MNELRVGIVGLSWAAGAHIETFKSVAGARVTALCSRRRHDPAELERRFGQPLKLFSDYEQMLADKDIDVIDLCSTSGLHPEQAIKAARAGKHLIIEKPVALTWDDAKAVRAAVNKAGVSAGVCFELRFGGQLRMARSVVTQGLLGDLHYGEVDYFHGIGPWYGQFRWNITKEHGGSALLTAGCHALDALLLLMDADVEEVTSYSTRSKSPIFAPYQYDTTSVTLLKFKGGKLGKVVASIDCLQPYYFHSHLLGSEGSLLDNKLHSNRIAGLDKTRWTTMSAPLADSGDVKDHPYLPQFQAFIDAAHAGQRMPLTDLDTAIESHRVMYAADLSAAAGRPVKLAEMA